MEAQHPQPRGSTALRQADGGGKLQGQAKREAAAQRPVPLTAAPRALLQVRRAATGCLRLAGRREIGAACPGAGAPCTRSVPSPRRTAAAGDLGPRPGDASQRACAAPAPPHWKWMPSGSSAREAPARAASAGHMTRGPRPGSPYGSPMGASGPRLASYPRRVARVRHAA